MSMASRNPRLCEGHSFNYFSELEPLASKGDISLEESGRVSARSIIPWVIREGICAPGREQLAREHQQGLSSDRDSKVNKLKQKGITAVQQSSPAAGNHLFLTLAERRAGKGGHAGCRHSASGLSHRQERARISRGLPAASFASHSPPSLRLYPLFKCLGACR